jgi:uncharacterized membrane protein
VAKKKDSKNNTEYTDPQLRARLKDEIQAGDRGGRPGQWSARKAQLLVKEYEKAGGGYTDPGHRSERQRHLQQWQEQDWHTAAGNADARGDGGTARYLPDVAWKLLSEEEREQTERPKKDSSEQFVANTDAAKEARRAAELLTSTAREASKLVRAMDTASQLERARTAEASYGNSRKTVLQAIDRRLSTVRGAD